ncbi:MAG: D-2-hydroxyacid dehydrogenase [Lachnospiraceae bacterium]|nr:D-2-hydroxyacid dehydrogenase [Lachnospiraceae bacterium]
MKIVFLEAGNLGEDMRFDRFFELGEVAVYSQTSEEMIAERIAEADAVLINKLPMNEDTLKDAKFLKYIGVTATGTNNIDFEYTKKRGITVTNVAGYSTDVVAQHTFAMTLYLLEHLRYYDDYVRSGDYCHSKSFCHMDRRFNELSGKTWGIIGLGAIGKRVAQIAEMFGCRVIYYSPSGKNKNTDYKEVDFDTLLSKSDIVSVHTPLTKKTHHMMDYDAFCKMKESAIFINVARGPIVDEKGLAKALHKEKIAAAGLDVLEHEPMDKDCPLRKLDDSERLLITPHIAWAAVEARTRLVDELWLNLDAFMNGEERNVCRK